MLAWLRDPIQDVKNIRVWSTTTSDVNGCESWVESKPLTFERDLLSHDCPALAIIDRLRELEYVARDVKQNHSKRSGLYYDCKNLPGRTAYLQCVLTRDQLFALGAVPFSSCESNAFYKLLLRSPREANSKLTALQCKSKLLQLNSSLPLPVSAPKLLPVCDIDGDSGDDDVRRAPARKRARRAEPLPLADIPHIEGDDVPLIDLAREVAGTSSSESSGSTHESGVSGDGEDGPDLSVYPRFINGTRIKHEQHKLKKDWGLRVSCPEHKGKCKRFRSLDMDTALYGIQAPVHYLATWLAGSRGKTMAEHRKWKPTRAEIRKHIEKHG